MIQILLAGSMLLSGVLKDAVICGESVFVLNLQRQIHECASSSCQLATDEIVSRDAGLMCSASGELQVVSLKNDSIILVSELEKKTKTIKLKNRIEINGRISLLNSAFDPFGLVSNRQGIMSIDSSGQVLDSIGRPDGRVLVSKRGVYLLLGSVVRQIMVNPKGRIEFGDSLSLDMSDQELQELEIGMRIHGDARELYLYSYRGKRLVPLTGAAKTVTCANCYKVWDIYDGKAVVFEKKKDKFQLQYGDIGEFFH